MIKDIGLFSDEKLCEIIVSCRYLGVLKEEAIESMQELARRRENGSFFAFEEKIKEFLAGLPKIEKDLHSMFRRNKIKIL
jgi:hypothetical protein